MPRYAVAAAAAAAELPADAATPLICRYAYSLLMLSGFFAIASALAYATVCRALPLL